MKKSSTSSRWCLWRRNACGCLLGILLSASAIAQTGVTTLYEGFDNSPSFFERLGSSTLDSTQGVAHGGTTALKMTGGSGQNYIALRPQPVNPHGAYRVNVWVKSDLASSAPAISVNAQQLDSSYADAGWYKNSFKLIRTGGRQQWTQYTATLNNLNPRTGFIKFYLRLDADAQGSVWFDDFWLADLNRLGDPGFEKGLWLDRAGPWTRVAADPHAGTHAVQVTGAAAQSYLGSEPIDIDPREAYDLSLWVKTTGLSNAGGVSVNILQVDANNATSWYQAQPGDYKAIKINGSDTAQWTRKTIRLSHFPAGTNRLRVYLRMDGGGAGTVKFDDVSLSRAYSDDFIWGISDHTAQMNHHVYPWAQLGQRLDKAAALGAGLYRVNYTPVCVTANTCDFSQLDELVNGARARGLKVYLVLFDGVTVDRPSIDEARAVREHTQASAREIAARYRGQIAYYQLNNEMDNKAIADGQGGEAPWQYPQAKYDVYRDWLRAASNGIREGDPHAKRVVNIAWTHTGFLEKLNADGVPWEVNGVDWYWNLDRGQKVVPADMDHTLSKVLDVLEGDSYPQQEILVSEANIKNGTDAGVDPGPPVISSWTEAQQASYISEAANEVYYRLSRRPGGVSRVKGFIVYELLDQPAGASKFEAHYGLWHYDAGAGNGTGTFGQPKAAYWAYHDLIKRKR